MAAKRSLQVIVVLCSAMLLFAALCRHSRARNTDSDKSRSESAPFIKALTIAQSADADSLDPSDIASMDALNIARLLWGTLYAVSRDGRIVPYLAESSQYAADGRSIMFKLRQNLRCEGGGALTASDVAYSFDRAADPKSNFTGNAPGFVLPALGYIRSRVDDPLTVTLFLKKYNPIALGLLSEMMILCKKPYEGMTRAEAATHPVASGPYRMAQWLHDDRIVLERNQDFTLPAPSYDRVIWRVIPEASTRSAELIAGNVDIITNVAPDQIDAINSSDTARVETIASTRRIYVGFSQNPQFLATKGGRAISNSVVRMAMQYAVDVPTICEALLRAACNRAATMVFPANDHSGIAAIPYDPERAERMLDAVGYPRGKDGVRFEIKLQAPRDHFGGANLALTIGQYLNDIGIKTDVDIMDFSSVYLSLTRQHRAGPLFLLGSGGALWSPLYDMSDLSSPDAGINYTDWSDPEFFDGWKKLDAAREEAQQQKIINEMLHVAHDRGTWMLLYFQPDVYGVSNFVSWKPRADETITLD
jgi:peptide/nickel transport system substrate-binding protein